MNSQRSKGMKFCLSGNPIVLIYYGDEKKWARVAIKLLQALARACDLRGNLLMTTFGTSDYMFTTKLQPPELHVTTTLQPPES